MNLVKPYARLFDVHERHDGIRLLKKIEWCGRISHRSEEAQTELSWDRFLRSVVLSKGDWSIVEHAWATVDAVVDRGITHEWVRHRMGSYTQESTRFVNYEKKMPASFIKPQFDDDAQGQMEAEVWEAGMIFAENTYRKLISYGCAPQVARSVFPNALASRIVVTYNLRNWRHFFLMRTTRETHPQMREVSIPLLEEFQAKIPLLYDDIVPLVTQAVNLCKMR